jgi:uncharacterized repeat protein (TIGR03803 family)
MAPTPTQAWFKAPMGTFYGTAYYGGDCSSQGGCGTIFKISPNGKFTRLYSFCSLTNCADGANPYAGLVLGTDGNFYGTASSGGTGRNCPGNRACGTVFKITPKGKLTTLYSFCELPNCDDGADPYAGLVQAVDRNFYGTTFAGGDASASGCNSFGCGTIFKITPKGRLTTLHAFCIQRSCPDGYDLSAGLVQGTDGNFYGTTEVGGTACDTVLYIQSTTSATVYGCGTVFKITPTGALTTLYSFCPEGYPCIDGMDPQAGLLQGTDGTFYGTTGSGGADGSGTVFSLAVGLGRFVETRPTSGKAGTSVIILGTNLTGTTGVSFNGTAAAFTVVSKSEIKTTVPAGANTGYVKVTTPSGTLTSNVPFRVIP